MNCYACGKETLKLIAPAIYNKMDKPMLYGPCCIEQAGVSSANLHLKIDNPFNKNITHAFAADARSRRLAEDGRTVVRDPSGKMPKEPVWEKAMTKREKFEAGL